MLTMNGRGMSHAVCRRLVRLGPSGHMGVPSATVVPLPT
jgi:hypothetical protein